MRTKAADVAAAGGRIVALGRESFRAGLRDRIFLNLIGFALVSGGAVVLGGQVSIGIMRELGINLGLTAIALTSAALATLLGTGLGARSAEQRTLYVILTRPVRRWELLAGRFAGVAALVTVNTLLMAALLVMLMAVTTPGASTGAMPTEPLASAAYFLLLQSFLVGALAMFFSSFTSPLLATVFTFSLFVIGGFADDLRDMARSAAGVGHWLAVGVTAVLPDLSSFNVIARVAHSHPVGLPLILLNTMYAALYTAGLLAGTAIIFSRQELP